MADTTDKTDIKDDVKAENTDAKAEGTPAAEKKPVDEVRRIKNANKTLQKERDYLKFKLEKFEKDAENAKLTEIEKYQKLVREKEKEAESARSEAAKAKVEREFERKVSTLVAKHKLADPEYGELVMKGYDPDEHEDFDAFVAEAKKKPSIARLFLSGENSDRVVDDEGNDVIPKVAGSSGAVKKGSNWEENERVIAKQLYPNDKTRQDNYIAAVKSLKAGK